MKDVLTKKRKETMEYFKNFVRSHGRQPTLAEIGKHFGIKTTAAWSRMRGWKKHITNCPCCGKVL